MAEKKINLKESLSKLNDIVSWFEEQDEVDVEVGLEKVKEGANLVKDCKARLSEIENEFETIQKEMDK
jgi:exodeoxyribonuclease VII small subunit